MINERNIEQDRKYWYAKGKWHGSWQTFWILFILMTAMFLAKGGNK